MTWTKLTDDYGDQHAQLSDAAFRTHTEGLLWVMRRERGARFPKRELRRFAETPQPEDAAAELVVANLWADHGTEYEVVAQYGDQVEPEVIARRRENDAARQRKARLKKAGIDPVTGEIASPAPSSQRESRRDTERDEHSDNPRDSGLVWTGLDGTGKDATKGDLDDVSTETWPQVRGIPKPAQQWCPAFGCSTQLRGIETTWGVCRDHRRGDVA